ncbi:MAG: DUF4833 domain-containing protein [Bacteroidales bacterium]|jgi:hypothetical protein|nr:DUF4833 domain-containing protein [Bacteroidales bacterium]
MKISRVAFFLIFISTVAYPWEISSPENDTYPNEKRLFHVERSLNRNIVCYDINISESGELNTLEPMTVYWIDREKYPGQSTGLNYIQKKLAFGYEIDLNSENGVTIKLNAIKNRKVYIEKDEFSKYYCKTNINNQLSILNKIYVKVRPSNSLDVEYIDLSGINPDNGSSVSERIYKK